MIAKLFRALVALTAAVALAADSPPSVVPKIDPQRYAGKWYEIARYPNRFESACKSDVVAEYTLRANGKVGVVNSCKQADGKIKQSKGTAKAAGKNVPNSKMKVTFFWPISGDYWILELDPEYRWALVGSPNREYLWIMSRTPKLDEAIYKQIIVRAQTQGFNAAKLIRVDHN